MKWMKKTAALITAAVTLLCTGCAAGSKLPETSIPDYTVPVNVLGEPSDFVPDVQVDKYQVPESEGMDFIRELHLGWNLGNTFDATNIGNISAEHELDYEKAWCGEFTKIENIAALKAAGFNTIRIPVSWHNHVDENFNISRAWLTRVKEVVDWCRDMDLYVIVNTHHDNEEDFYYPDSAHMESSKKYLTAVWSQIAEAFKDYDEHLILESLNEPRLVGTNYEWWIDQNNEQCKDAVSCINTLNQLFVDTVRASGGNNASRWLLVPGYAASPDGALNPGFAMPTDPQSRVILSVHAYRPYNFALNKTGTKEWSLDNASDTGDIIQFMDNLYGKFVLNGVPVLIGEFGAMNKDNLEARVAFSAYYTACARARGISCLWWDNNAFAGSGENFGLLYRKSSSFTYPEIVQALVKGSDYQ
ncbi:MAG: glycoside hydrolase family 5 protein [Oscillospiraceae bacterium]|nr:glycoside hydrolase family 5 protein [Oscillospiraceae bacterium]